MSQQPLIIAYHLIWTTYGAWLPNDPRGSGSTSITGKLIADLGELHYGRKKVQPPCRELRAFYDRAKPILYYPPLTFDEQAHATVGAAFGQVIEEQKYTCYGCVVMPDHVHILIRKHKHMAEEMADCLRSTSRQALIATELREADHPVWCGGSAWKIFLDHPAEVRRTIRYIERNPLPLKLPVQRWPFVKEYDDWPLHKGHSPNSPYAVRLKAVGRYPDDN